MDAQTFDKNLRQDLERLFEGFEQYYSSREMVTTRGRYLDGTIGGNQGWSSSRDVATSMRPDGRINIILQNVKSRKRYGSAG